MKRVRIDNFCVIQGWMLEIGCSNWNEIAAYALIYGFSQDGETEFEGSLSYIQEWLMCSRQTAITTLKKLEEKHLIKKTQYSVNGVKFNRYSAAKPQCTTGLKNRLPIVQNLDYHSLKIRPNNNIDNDIDNDIPPVSISTPNVVDILTPPKGGSESAAPEIGFVTESVGVEKVSNVSQAELEFDKFRKAYRGTKRGLVTEFAYFQKQHRDWKNVLPTLIVAYEHQCALKDEARVKGCFVPQEKNLKTYIHNRGWEEELHFELPLKNHEPSIEERMRSIENGYQKLNEYEKQKAERYAKEGWHSDF